MRPPATTPDLPDPAKGKLVYAVVCLLKRHVIVLAATISYARAICAGTFLKITPVHPTNDAIKVL